VSAPGASSGETGPDEQAPGEARDEKETGEAGPGEKVPGERATWPTATTRLAGVIGDPVRHSLSPVLHNAAFAALGLDWVYVALPVPAGQAAQALEGARALGIEGLSVTMPHKAAVAGAVDRRSEVAALLGSVNAVVRRGRHLIGESTDGEGFLRAASEEAGFDAAGRRCLVVGSGGGARAVILALARAGASRVVVAGRTPSRVEAAAALAGPVGRVGQTSEADDAELVVNATPVGMAGQEMAAPPVPIDRLGPGQLVVDLIYHPPATALVEAARARGATGLGGLGMLVHQAALAFELWTGCPAPVQAMWRAVGGSPADRAGPSR
jgi:shikimate dehydrogenase